MKNLRWGAPDDAASGRVFRPPPPILDEYDAEVRQADTRFKLIGLSCLYVLLRWTLPFPRPMPTDLLAHLLAFFGAFAVWSALLRMHIRRVKGRRHSRRVVAMLGDYGALSYVMNVGGEMTMPFFALVVWVAVGMVMRFGQRYLVLAAVLAQLCLLSLVAFSPYWHQHDVMLTFSVTALALPIYALILQRHTARARDAALEAMQAKTRFLAQASHDLRQPIHAIGYHIEALRNGPLDNGQREVVNRIERALGGVARLFKSLLDIARLDSGAVEVSMAEVRLGPMLGNIVQQLRQFAQARGVEIRVVKTDRVVRADPTLLEMMVSNLLSNAIKYSNGTRVLMGVRMRGGRLAMEVHDCGVGIDDAYLPHVFEEFSRSRRSGGSDVEGVGLGLSIVRRLADLCGLSVELRSVQGRGTSVRLTGFESVAHATPGMPPAPLRSRVPGPLGGFSVILIEDDADVLDAMAQVLRSWGCDVQAFRQMPQACGPADAIVADYDLGAGTDGLEVVEALRRELGEELPALIVTGHTEREVRERIAGKSIIVLPKPVQAVLLRSALSSLRFGMDQMAPGKPLT